MLFLRWMNTEKILIKNTLFEKIIIFSTYIKMPTRKTYRTRVPSRQILVQRGGNPAFLASAVPILQQTRVLSKGSRKLARSNVPVVSELAKLATPVIRALGFAPPPKRRVYRRRR